MNEKLRSSRSKRGRGALAAALATTALATAALTACGDGDPVSPSGAASGSATVAVAAPTGPVKHPPRHGDGSAAALSKDGQHIYVADEDHEVVFVAPTSFADPSTVRVVPMPGPPAQVVAADDLVLVTVRTLPTDDARAARADLRGPEPQASAVRRLQRTKLSPSGGEYLVPKEYQHYLEDSPSGSQAAAPSGPGAAAGASPAGSAAGASPSGSVAASAAPSASTSASASAPAAAKPKASPNAGTPPKLLDTKVVRQSQGGLLVALRPDAEKGLVEIGRVVLPADAWGLGVTPDGLRAVVTSAWSAEISVVDVNAMKVIASFPAGREPRGVTITKDGKTAYVSHLVGTDLTRIDGLDGTPKASVQPLPAAPSRTPHKATLSASLGYSLVLSPDDESLYVPRHAIGAEGHDSWWGAAAVDVLDRKTGKPAAPLHRWSSPGNAVKEEVNAAADWMAWPGRLPAVRDELVQPRAVVYRKKTDTLLVVGEGYATLVELDALAPDPAMFVRRVLGLAVYDFWGHHPIRGGAPSAIALSDDDDTAYVYCRTTFDLIKIDLESKESEWLRLAEDGLPERAAKGRRLFADARSPQLSGGLACAACHPEGRDDGYVWREALLEGEANDTDAVFLGLRANMKQRLSGGGVAPAEVTNKYYPRQTPMLAGRLRSPGPYGWHAESANLAERLKRGFRLHRSPWADHSPDGDGPFLAKIDALGNFIQSSLLPPPTVSHALTEVEKRGKTIFESSETQCVKCHVPDTELTDRTAYPLRALPVAAGFDAETNAGFKTPSLYFVAATAPYFHDGSAATLEALVKNNGSRMGQTGHLSAQDQAALVAYLTTL